jgi:hypothetical protein
MGERRDGWRDGRRERARGEYRFMKLMKLKKGGGNYAFFYFAGNRSFFIYIYEVFTSPEKEKRSTNHYSHAHTQKRTST